MSMPADDPEYMNSLAGMRELIDQARANEEKLFGRRLPDEADQMRAAVEAHAASLLAVGDQVTAQTPAIKDRQFRFISAGELVFRPADWLIRDYLETDSVVGMVGPSACMKTFTAIDMGLCISAVIPWHGHPVKQQGPVLYVCGEGKAGIKKRITAWERHHGTTAEKFFVSTGPAQLLDPGSLADVEAAADEIAANHGNPALIIVDTLNRNFGPGDENSTGDMTMFVQALDRLRNRLQCAVMVVHHTGLGDSGRGRGSSALRGALDFEYLCEKTGTEIDEIQITLTNTKTKDHEPPQAKTFKPFLIDLGLVDDDLRPVSSIVLEPTEPTRKRVRLSLPNQIALESLRALGVLHGEHVSENSWRNECYARGIATTDTPDARRKSFLRARTYLLAQNIVATRDDQYWIQSDFSEPGHRDIPGQVPPCHVWETGTSGTHP